MRKRAKVDSNHVEIVEALRRTGHRVLSLAAVGGGCPDLVCERAGVLRFIEVKGPKAHLTMEQQRFIEQGWPVKIVRSVEEALAL